MERARAPRMPEVEEVVSEVNARWGSTSNHAAAIARGLAARGHEARPSFKFTLKPPQEPGKVPEEPYCNPDSAEARWRAHQVKMAGRKKEHPLFQTTGKIICSRQTDKHLERSKNVRASKFSEYCMRGHMLSKNMSLNTGTYSSRSHKMHDGVWKPMGNV